MAETRPQSPGLKYRNRAGGASVPYWFADPKAIAAGFPVKSSNLSGVADSPRLIVQRCERLQEEMRLWMIGERKGSGGFNGSFKSLFELYQNDPESPFHKIKPGTVRTYMVYLKRLIGHIGLRRIDRTDGRDVMKWFSEWRKSERDETRDQLAVARTCLAILKKATSFGIVCRAAGCVEFKAILDELEFERPKRRSQAPTAEQIVAARRAAQAAGAPERALVYSLQFETTGRQWDFIGQWLPLTDRKPSLVLDRGEKWVGPMWSWIDDNLILNMTPTKTEDTTGVEVWFDLSACPMVMEDIAQIPPIHRNGPLISSPKTGLPYRYGHFLKAWRRDFKAAGLPKEIWNRDMRAGGITEGAKSGASRDDRRTVAGHASEQMTERYERGTVSLEAHRRTMALRIPSREKKD